MDFVINAILSVICSLIAADIVIYHKKWCRRIIGLAAKRLPDDGTRAARHEEWLADLMDTEGVFASFRHAIGCCISAPALARRGRSAIAERKPANKSTYVVRIYHARHIGDAARSAWNAMRTIDETVQLFKTGARTVERKTWAWLAFLFAVMGLIFELVSRWL